MNCKLCNKEMTEKGAFGMKWSCVGGDHPWARYERGYDYIEQVERRWFYDTESGCALFVVEYHSEKPEWQLQLYQWHSYASGIELTSWVEEKIDISDTRWCWEQYQIACWVL